MKYTASLILSLFCLSASAYNFAPNSSFECGYSRGWCAYLTGPNQSFGNLQFGNGLLTNDTFHGKYALIVPNSSRLISSAIWLTNGNYKISFYGKGSGNLPYGVFNGVDLGIGANPPNTAALTGAWTRYSSTFVAASNSLYWIRFGFLAADAIVDAVQLEEGGSVTAYAPQAVVEAGLSIPNTNNMWFSGDTPSFNLNFWNTGAAVNQAVQYTVYDSWNSNVASATITSLLAAGTNTVVNVSLPSQKGWLKIVSRVSGYEGSGDEMAYVNYPYTSNSTYTTSTWLGGHPHISPFHSHRERLAYRPTARNLSPNGLIAVKWQSVQPSTNTDFVFFDVCYTNWANEGLGQVCCLHPTDETWNEWATNSDGTASMPFWSNYCYMVANRVCNGLGLTNTYFEVGPNEPLQRGLTGPPINVTIATNYAKCLTYGIWGVTQAYANAKIIGIAGAYGNGDWAWEVWTNLSAASQAAIAVISTHQYPNDLNADPNIGEYETSRFTQPGPWIRQFGALRPVWNTESGTSDSGPELGLNGFWPIAYYFYWAPTYESERSERMLRQLTSSVRILPEALRCIGYGMRKYFYYDCRYFNDSSFNTGQPYSSDYMQVDRPGVVALSVAASLVQYGFGPVTNTAMYPYLEMYCYTNSAGSPIVAAWSADRTNRTLTLTNASYELLDMMGNQIQTNSLTALVCRVPRYFRSTTLTLAQLSNTLVAASSVNIADFLAPKISLDIAPVGLWSGDATPVLFKWSAIDDTFTAWQSTDSNTNVVTKWKLDGGSYSVFSPTNHVFISSLSSGNHTFYVTASDAIGNQSELVYPFLSTNSSSGSRLIVSGNLSVGTLTIGP